MAKAEADGKAALANMQNAKRPENPFKEDGSYANGYKDSWGGGYFYDDAAVKQKFKDDAAAADVLAQKLKGQVLDLKALKQTAKDYGAALGEAMNMKDYAASKLADAENPAKILQKMAAESAANDWWAKTKAENTLGPSGAAQEEKAARETLRERLPSPVIQAEELFGPKTVTEGLPQYADAQKDLTEAVKDNTQAVKDSTKNTDYQPAQPAGPQINVLTGW